MERLGNPLQWLRLIMLIVTELSCNTTQQRTPRRILLGDSIVSDYPSPVLPRLNTYMSHAIYDNLAVAGDTTDNQLTRLKASPYISDQNVTLFIIQVGINPVASGNSLVTVVGDYAKLRVSIAAGVPNADVLFMTMLPARQALTDPKYTVWLQANQFLVDYFSQMKRTYVWNGATNALNDGSGYLTNHIGDGVHTDATGRQINADQIDAAINAYNL